MMPAGCVSGGTVGVYSAESAAKMGCFGGAVGQRERDIGQHRRSDRWIPGWLRKTGQQRGAQHGLRLGKGQLLTGDERHRRGRVAVGEQQQVGDELVPSQLCGRSMRLKLRLYRAWRTPLMSRARQVAAG